MAIDSQVCISLISCNFLNKWQNFYLRSRGGIFLLCGFLCGCFLYSVKSGTRCTRRSESFWFCSALSHGGHGYVAGVAVAITQGGPGAIFWMWVCDYQFSGYLFACRNVGNGAGRTDVFHPRGVGGETILAMFFATCGMFGCLPPIESTDSDCKICFLKIKYENNESCLVFYLPCLLGLW